MEIAKTTARGQTTIPKGVREAAGLREGDVLSFEIEGHHLVVHKVAAGRDHYLHGLSSEFEYRFNRRFHLPELIPRLAYGVLGTPPMPEKLLKPGLAQVIITKILESCRPPGSRYR